MNFFGQMGAFFLAIVFGKIVDAAHNFNLPLYLIAAILLFGGIIWLFINPAKKIVAETAIESLQLVS